MFTRVQVLLEESSASTYGMGQRHPLGIIRSLYVDLG
jgi:hypothetical protein